ncbi:uncharacterized protein Ecym_1462 [Eremothecium cymbalariae DBVPG|uniref:Transcription activator GCR1-like domain-containing protein n=1 Tax=Eremothecium cymbalariae (strain CBS 270.75 / DBVPG 7215 / KCTC 17166 / NRRL Y-17582) TaxID=931890 RepID=G8JMH1_ERECY|nr:hypothetical protein Ecym_1462 [Eremothecium cymbalariae DBVPG\
MENIKVNPKLQALMEQELGLTETVDIHGSGGTPDTAELNKLFGDSKVEINIGYNNMDNAAMELPTPELTAQHHQVPSSLKAPQDDKYLQSDSFHYTSSFQARPYSDYFDFDSKDKQPQQRVNNNGLSNNNQISRYSKFKELKDPYKEVMTDGTGCGSDSESDVDEVSNGIQEILDQILDFKNEFRELITKIDEASTASARSRYLQAASEHLNNTEEIDLGTNAVMSEVVDTVIQSLHDLLPKKSHRKRDSVSISFKDPWPLKKPKTERSVSMDDVKNATSSSILNRVLPHSSTEIREDPCSKMPNFGVVLIKSPSLISQLWDEYTKLPNEWALKDHLSFTLQLRDNGALDLDLIGQRKTTIRELERKYGSSWRNTDKNFSRQINRRKKIWRSIEEGLEDGLELNQCFEILESHIKKRGKGLSWYYNGVPFRLRDMLLSKELSSGSNPRTARLKKTG